jgi:hypothetical protein
MKESEARESQRDFPWSEKDKQERNNKRKKEERELFVYGLRDFADTGSCLILGCTGRDESCDHLPRH